MRERPNLFERSVLMILNRMIFFRDHMKTVYLSNQITDNKFNELVKSHV